MERSQLSAIVVGTLLVGAAVGAGAMAMMGADTSPASASTDGESTPEAQQPTTEDGPRSTDEAAGLVQFDSAADFSSYVSAGQDDTTAYVTTGVSRQVSMTADAAPTMESNGNTAQATRAAGGSGGMAGTPRASSTNVQVAGIDEPDYLKTTGSTTYYSPTSRQYYFGRPVEPEPTVEDDVVVSDRDEPVRPRQRQTHVFDTSDPARPDEIAGINATGKLLRTGDRLVVFEDERLVGYDISDPANPTEV